MTNSTNKIDEVLLWKQMRLGDEKSFSVIFKSNYSSLYAYGIKVIPFPDFVRDQIQNLFMNIWQTRERLGEVKNLKAYLLISLRRQLLSSKKFLVEFDSIDSNSEKDIKSLVFEPNEFVDKDEISSTLKKSLLENLNSLPVKQREIIFLRFYHKLTYLEISEIIGVKQQSVKNVMPKIFEKLRKGLSDFNRDDFKDVDVFLFEFFILFSKDK